MKYSFLIAMAAFSWSFVLHAFVWRTLKPQNYLIWLPLLFFITPIIACSIYFITGISFVKSNHDTLIFAAILYIPLVVCYTGGYAGIVEYSPSAEILRTVSKYPEGISMLELEISSLNESALTGKRLKHLLINRLIKYQDDRIVLTSRGLKSVQICEIYRWIFGIKESAGG